MDVTNQRMYTNKSWGFLSLPGELRNRLYELMIDKYEHQSGCVVPFLATPDNIFQYAHPAIRAFAATCRIVRRELLFYVATVSRWNVEIYITDEKRIDIVPEGFWLTSPEGSRDIPAGSVREIEVDVIYRYTTFGHGIVDSDEEEVHRVVLSTAFGVLEDFPVSVTTLDRWSDNVDLGNRFGAILAPQDHMFRRFVEETMTQVLRATVYQGRERQGHIAGKRQDLDMEDWNAILERLLATYEEWMQRDTSEWRLLRSYHKQRNVKG